MDGPLGLAPEQHTALIKAFTDWPGKEYLSFPFYLRNTGTLPTLPEDLLAQHLKPEQISLYQQARKVEVRTDQMQTFPSEETFGE